MILDPTSEEAIKKEGRGRRGAATAAGASFRQGFQTILLPITIARSLVKV